jgi:hypothetical protein
LIPVGKNSFGCKNLNGKVITVSFCGSGSDSSLLSDCVFVGLVVGFDVGTGGGVHPLVPPHELPPHELHQPLVPQTLDDHHPHGVTCTNQKLFSMLSSPHASVIIVTDVNPKVVHTPVPFTVPVFTANGTYPGTVVGSYVTV